MIFIDEWIFSWVLEGSAIQDVWIGPVYNLVAVMEARLVRDEIIQELINSLKERERWIFSDITDNSFRRRSVKSEDDGGTWRITQKMNARRRRRIH